MDTARLTPDGHSNFTCFRPSVLGSEIFSRQACCSTCSAVTISSCSLESFARNACALSTPARTFSWSQHFKSPASVVKVSSLSLCVDCALHLKPTSWPGAIGVTPILSSPNKMAAAAERARIAFLMTFRLRKGTTERTHMSTTRRTTKVYRCHH